MHYLYFQASEVGELLNYIDVKAKEKLEIQNMVSQSICIINKMEVYYLMKYYNIVQLNGLFLQVIQTKAKISAAGLFDMDLTLLPAVGYKMFNFV